MTKLNKMRRMIVLTLAMSFLLALCAPALASTSLISGTNQAVTTSEFMETVAATTALNVRSGPSTKYTILGVLAKGEQVQVLGYSGSWSVINYGGRVAYAHSSYLVKADSSTTVPAGYVQATTGVNVRTGPSTMYTIVGSLDKGDVVKKVGSIYDWAIIEWNGGTAYVYGSYLTESGSSGTPSYGQTQYAMKVTAIRTGASSFYPVVTYVPFGAKVTVTNYVGSYAYITYGSYKGYVLASDLSGGPSYPDWDDDDWDDDDYDAYGYAFALTGVNVRSGPGDNYSIEGTLESGEALPYTGSVGNWIRVEYEGKAAYIYSRYVKVITDDDEAEFKSANMWVYDTGSRATVYRAPIESNTYRYGYMEQYEKVRLTGYNDEWARIEADGMILYTKVENVSQNQGR